MNNKSSISHWLDSAAQQLAQAGISSARLDAEIILAHTVRKGRTYLHAHSEEEIDPRFLDILDTRLALRLDRVPVAYIIGHKEFYGRIFNVTPSTLIPRPESEAMIDLLKKAIQQPALPLPVEAPRLVDVGTGSGCLGITAKLEIPELDVTLTDISRHALSVAIANAKRLDAKVATLRSNLLQAYPYVADFILANLPYVGKDWEVSPETRHEPGEALYASNNGLALINRLLEEAPSRLSQSGLIFIEADQRQHGDIVAKAKSHNLSLADSQGLILVFRK